MMARDGSSETRLLRWAAALLLIGARPVPAAPSQEDFPGRVRIEGARVWVDGKPLYEGAGRKADVSVEDFQGWKLVVIAVDGRERARLPVRSLRKPVAWPPVYLEEIKPQLTKILEDDGGKVTLVLRVETHDGVETEIYRGRMLEARTDRTAEGLGVLLDGRTYYRLASSARPLVTPKEVAEYVNACRQRAGLPGLSFSAELSRGCDLHALYVVRNAVGGLTAHDEDPSGIGYTPEGARAGGRGLLSQFRASETPRDAVDGILATLYHRLGILDPGIAEIGVGWAYRKDGMGQLVMDPGEAGSPRTTRNYPILYPAPGQEGVPPEFGLGAGEQPNPLPEPGAKAGYPVTIQFSGTGWRPVEAEARLLVGGREIPCWISTPERPARKDRPQPLAVCLIPREKLKPSTTYTVRFACRQGGVDGGPAWSREWSFATRP